MAKDAKQAIAQRARSIDRRCRLGRARAVIISLGSVSAGFPVRAGAPLAADQAQPGGDVVRLGGKAAKVAFLSKRLGHEPVLLGRVGNDDLREEALAPLRRAGISLNGITLAENAATAVSTIAAAPDRRQTVGLAPNANDNWDDWAIETALATIRATSAGSVLVADYEIAPRVATRAIVTAADRGLLVVLDPAPANRVDRSVLRRCDAISSDASEAAELTDTDTSSPEGAARAASALAAHGPRLVCVKLGDGGCVFAEGGTPTYIPPAGVDVVDSAATGDAFTGALAVALFERQPITRAVLFAAAASYLEVTADGAQEPVRRREAIERLVPRLAARTHRLPD